MKKDIDFYPKGTIVHYKDSDEFNRMYRNRRFEVMEDTKEGRRATLKGLHDGELDHLMLKRSKYQSVVYPNMNEHEAIING